MHARRAQVRGEELLPQQVQHRRPHQDLWAVREAPDGLAERNAVQVNTADFIQQSGVEQPRPAVACQEPQVRQLRLRWFGPHLEPPAMGLHHLLGPAQAERDLRLVHQPVRLDLHHQWNIPFS